MIGSQSFVWRDATQVNRVAMTESQRAGASPATSITNAAEEIAQFFSQARLQDRSLKERGLELYESPALRRVEEVDALLQIIWAKGETQDQAQQLAQQLLASAGNPSALDRQLRQINGSTEQFLLLSKALAQGSLHGGNDPAVEALRDRVDALWARDGVRIRADVNIAPGLADAEDKGAKDRQVYRDAVLDGGTLPRMLTLLVSQYGESIEAAVERLRRALGADMGAARPSLPVERLRAILHELFVLGALLPFLKNCRDLGRRAHLRRRKDLHRRAGEVVEGDEGDMLLGELAEWLPRWLTVGDVRTLLYHYGLSMEQGADAHSDDRESVSDASSTPRLSPQDRLLVLLHGVRSILQQIPERLFPDREHKLNADEVFVGLLDDLILGAADEPPQPQS